MFCSECNTNWRTRALVLAVLQGTGSNIAPIPEMSPNYFWRGIGMSDHMSLVGALSMRFNYTNTFFGQFPHLNLLEIPTELHSQFGFVVCSDVLEHVPPPVDPALVGLVSLLAPHGFAVVSVPVHGNSGPTREYYEGLKNWNERDGKVRWWDEANQEHLDESPEYHGGVGQTLAFRLWSEDDFAVRLRKAGMSSVVKMEFNSSLGVPEIKDSGLFICRSS